jgi:hypothetical protein
MLPALHGQLYSNPYSQPCTSVQRGETVDWVSQLCIAYNYTPNWAWPQRTKKRFRMKKKVAIQLDL